MKMNTTPPLSPPAPPPPLCCHPPLARRHLLLTVEDGKSVMVANSMEGTIRLSKIMLKESIALNVHTNSAIWCLIQMKKHVFTFIMPTPLQEEGGLGADDRPYDVVTELFEGLVETYPGLQYLNGFPEVKVVSYADVSSTTYDGLSLCFCGNVFASPNADSILIEEKRRALLQLQWKVMGDKPQEDQEVNSKKNYSKTINPDGIKTTQRAPVNGETEPEDSPYRLRESQTPVTNLMKEVEKGKPGSLMSIPKHSGKVTHHEYEVETANGRTITKRKETKSTVMFGDPRKHQKRQTFKVKTLSVVCKSIKGGKTNPSNIGDLFSESICG